MFLAEQVTFEEFKILALAFIGIFIPLLIAYKISKKTNFMVFILTLALFSVLTNEFKDVIGGISEEFGALMQESCEVFFSPITNIIWGALSFVGLGEMDPLLIVGALWAVFFILGLIGAFFGPVKVINTTINTLLGLVVIALIVMFIIDPWQLNS